MTEQELTAVKQALEALKSCNPGAYSTGYVIEPYYDEQAVAQAIKALQSIIDEQALEQLSDEPVARVIDNGTPEGVTEWIPFAIRVEPLKTGDLLYTRPQAQAQPAAWVGLTDEEVDEWTPEIHSVIRAIEAKLKAKNSP